VEHVRRNAVLFVAISLLSGFGGTAMALVPDALLGRVAATANTAMFGPIAAFIPLGALAVRAGSVPPNVAAVAVCLAAATLAVFRRRPRRPSPADLGLVAPHKSRV
jgi:hypothetical protein